MPSAADRIIEDATHFLAGRTVPPGTYRIVGTNRVVRLAHEDILPATFDGHIAVYERCPATWAEIQDRNVQIPQVLPDRPADASIAFEALESKQTGTSAMMAARSSPVSSKRIVPATAESARLRKRT